MGKHWGFHSGRTYPEMLADAIRPNRDELMQSRKPSVKDIRS